MSSKPDFIRKKFGPLREKTLRNALAHRIVKEFPRIGGPRICQLCADMILEVISKHMRSQEHVTHGQALWMAVSVNNPPAHRQRIADTDLVPVLLDLCTAEDVQQRIDRRPAPERLLHKVLRLCQQAHEQGGLLSNCDLAELLNTTDSEIAHVLARHERLTNTVVPRRATLHDVGTGLTHKRIICWKRYAEGKEPHLVARDLPQSGGRRPLPRTIRSRPPLSFGRTHARADRARPWLRPALGPGVSCDRRSAGEKPWLT